METLKDHVIIYDDECPLCNAYTKLFIKTGMLDSDGRERYINSAHKFPFIDKEKAKNEIALINKKDNTVTYGIHSLFKIIGNRFSLFTPLFNSPIFQFLMKKLYFFISYNRKVIAPGKLFEVKYSCNPILNIPYRMVYIIFSLLVTSLILYHYSDLLTPFVPSGTLYRELVICGGQIVFQGIMVAYFQKIKVIHYLGNLMTISLGGAILLTPMLIVDTTFASDLFILFYFLSVAFLMFLEHVRRVKLLELPAVVSFTWVLYRILVLLVIL